MSYNRLLKTFILILTLYHFPCSLAQEVHQLTWVTEEFPPYSYTTVAGEKSGIYPELVREILSELGIADKTTLLTVPWARGIKMLQEESGVVLFPMMMTPERRAKYRFLGPLPGVSDDGLITSTDIADQIEELPLAEALNKLENCAVGIVANSSLLERLERFVPRQCIVEVDSEQRLVRMLAKQRLAAIVADNASALWHMQNQEIASQQFRMTHVLAKGNGGIALSKSLPEKTYRQLSRAFENALQGEEFRALVLKHRNH